MLKFRDNHQYSRTNRSNYITHLLRAVKALRVVVRLRPTLVWRVSLGVTLPVQVSHSFKATESELAYFLEFLPVNKASWSSWCRSGVENRFNPYTKECHKPPLQLNPDWLEIISFSGKNTVCAFVTHSHCSWSSSWSCRTLSSLAEPGPPSGAGTPRESPVIYFSAKHFRDATPSYSNP